MAASKARFPGKPTKNTDSIGRVRVSYQDTDDADTEESEYSRSAFQISTNLKAFQTFLGREDEDGMDFHGFAVDDKFKMICQEKLERIVNEIAELKVGILGGGGSNRYFSSNKPAQQNSGHVLNSSDSLNFLKLGQSEIKPRPMKAEIAVNRRLTPKTKFRKFSAQFLSPGTKQNVPTSVPSTTMALTNTTTESSLVPIAQKSNINELVEQSKGNVNAGREEKTAFPVDNANFRRIKGARIKQINYNDQSSQRIAGPFCDIIPLPTKTIRGIENIPKLPEGALRSGKFVLQAEAESDSDMEVTDEVKYFDSPNGRMRIVAKRRIRGICPLDHKDIEQNGFPITVDVENGSVPNKPLCFLCASAGIEQLIFCSSCCEPYHPFCAGDDSLLSSFVARATHKRTHSSDHEFPFSIGEMLKRPIPVYYNEGPKAVNIVNPLASLLSPPLTPRPLQQLEKDLEVEKEIELNEQLLNWKCNRCIRCQICKLHYRKGNEKVNEFFKCFQCHLSYHSGCLKKNTRKSSTEKWICEECFKCKSCGKKIDRRMGQSEVNTNKLMLCLDCFRQRQKGSFCPVCQMCYDDNDFETKMMECAKCEKWIHARCERLSDEQYQILSNLPESVEYICRLCECGEDAFWRQAIGIEISNGCDSVFRIFQKKAISMCRKKRLMKFGTDNPEEPGPVNNTQTNTNPGNNAASEQAASTKKLDAKLPSASAAPNLKTLKIILTDFIKQPVTVEQSSFLLKTAGVEIIDRREKTPERIVQKLDLVSTPSPLKRIATFFDSVASGLSIHNSVSVRAMYISTMKSLEQTFIGEDQLRLETLKEYFDSSVREVFPWFNPVSNEKEELDSSQQQQFPLGELSTDESGRINNSEEYPHTFQSKFSGMDPFQDTYWNPEFTDDSRHCAFCLGVGDFPPDFCGRLLWAGLTDWVHVNCALWSSEVWEENDGALQQVGAALNRSKNLICAICNKSGASVSCCRSSCQTTFHFPCALNSDCGLLDDKSIFCPKHASKSVDEYIRTDMQVMRKVFVDQDWLRRKEKIVDSANLNVFIGSLRINSLGYVVPISGSKFEEESRSGDDETRTQSLLIPMGYECSRLFWSQESSTSKTVFSISAILPDEWFKLKQEKYKQDIHIVVDHMKQQSAVERKLNDIRLFHDWIDSCPIYIDEYKREWLPPCPLELSIDSDNEETTMEDVEVQTSFRSFSLSKPGVITSMDSLHDDPSPVDIFQGDANFFNDYLTPDAVAHLHSCVNDMIGDEWTDLDTETCEMECSNKKPMPNFFQPKELIVDYHIIQVDGAYDMTSEDESSSGDVSDEEDGSSKSSTHSTSTASSSEDEGESVVVPSPQTSSQKRNNSSSTQSKKNTRKLPAATTSKNVPKRMLRSRDKQPKLEDKKEEFKCSVCKKTFVSETSLNRHSRWCKPKRKLRVKARIKAAKAGFSTELEETKTTTSSPSPRKRGRPKRSTTVTLTENSNVENVGKTKGAQAQNSNPKPQNNAKRRKKSTEADLAPAPSSSSVTSQNKNSDITRSARSNKLKSVVTTPVSSSNRKAPDNRNSGQSVKTSCENERVSCSKCKNVYRTVESLNKHMLNCYTLSSSSDCDEDEQENTEISSRESNTIPLILDSHEDETESEESDEEASDVVDEKKVSPENMSQTEVYDGPATPVEEVVAGSVSPVATIQESNLTQRSESLMNVLPAAANSPVKIQETKLPLNSPIPTVRGTAYLQALETNTDIQNRTETTNNCSPLPVKVTDPSTLTTMASARPIIEQTLPREILVPVPERTHVNVECNQQLQNILTQFQNNKDYTIQIKGQMPNFPIDGNRQQQLQDNTAPTPPVLVTGDTQRNTHTHMHMQITNPSMDVTQSQQPIPSFYSNIPQANLNPHILSQMQAQAQFLSQGLRPGLPQIQNHHQHDNQFINPSSDPRLLQHTHTSHLYNPDLVQPQIGNVGWAPGGFPPQHLNPMERFNPQFQRSSDIMSQMHPSHSQMQQQQPLQTVVMQDCNGQLVNFQIPYPSPSQQQNQYLQYASNYHHLQQQQQQQSLQMQLQQQQQQHQQQIAEALFQQQQQQHQAMQQAATATHGYFPPQSYPVPVPPRPEIPNPAPTSTFYRQIAAPHHESTQQQAPSGLPSENMTYMVVQQAAPSNTAPTSSMAVENDKQQQPMCSPQPQPSIVRAASSPQQPQFIQCTKVKVEQPGSVNSISHACSTATTSKPCPCPDCHQQRVLPGVPIEKAANKITPATQKKIQRQLGFSPTTWGLNVPVAASPPKKTATKPGQVRPKGPQLMSIMAAERQGQGILVYKSMMSPSTLPKLLPATIVTTSGTNTLSTISSPMTSTQSVSDSVCLPGKLPVSSPNIAVVRPMEQHPLQRLTDQIQQIESTFLSSGTGTSTPPPATATASNETTSQNSPNPVLTPDVSNGGLPSPTRIIRPVTGTGIISVGPSGSSAFVASSRVEPSERIAAETRPPTPILVKTVKEETTLQPSTPPKPILEPSPLPEASSKTKTIPDSNKAIKITLKRKEGGDSYSIDNISDPGSQTAPGRPGTMRSLKIKAKITSGEQAGTSTDVVVLPVVHTVPIPDPDLVESNLTVVEEFPGSSFPPTGDSLVLTFPEKVAPTPKLPNRLTHRAVIVYEVRCNDAVLFRSSDVRAVWDHIFETVQGTTVNHNLPPLSYPATNISLPDNKRDAAASFNQLGLTHRAVQFLLEQLPGANKTVKESHTFRFHDPPTTSAEDSLVPENPSGSARTEPYSGRKPFDMFGWLASKHRKPMVPTQNKYGDLTKVADLPMAMKYRNLSKQGNKHLNVYWSKIHGRGLFTSRDIEENDMIIEYAGEVIRSTICDLREKYYDSKGIGCYMFRIDEKYVVDATMKGNAARFINHSCEPNCRSKMMDILGKKHILIFATKRISCGEELTYDYKFPFEDIKIPCYCGSSKCRKFLN